MSKGETTNNQNLIALHKEYDTKNPTTLIAFDKIRNGSVHPTQKPVALLEYLIKTYTNEGETVLDFTMGSGSTGVACLNTNRNFIGIELDQKYYNIAKSRLEEVK
jgi:DNA modification methylase